MNDESIRMHLAQEINAYPDDRITGETWTTSELTEQFTVHAFAAPFVIVTRKSTGQRGTLMFRHSPRRYWDFRPD